MKHNLLPRQNKSGQVLIEAVILLSGLVSILLISLTLFEGNDRDFDDQMDKRMKSLNGFKLYED